MSKESLNKSGVKGRNKKGKRTTAWKQARKRAQKRNDSAWVFSDDAKKDDKHDGNAFRKSEDAWMYEHVAPHDAPATSKTH